MKWLSGLLAEVDKITVFIDSTAKVESLHQVIGELPDHLKRMFSYCMAMADRLKDLRKEAEETDSRKAAGEIRRSVRRLESRMEIASAIMWQEIKFEFREQINQESSFYICTGWKVCTKKETTAAFPFLNFFAGPPGE